VATDILSSVARGSVTKIPVTAGTRTLELLESARRYNRWTFERVRDGLGNRVLEIGCGTGTFTQFLVDRELVVGLEVEAEYADFARARFRDRPNVVIRLLDVTASSEELRPYGFDSAISVNVFEHIDDDLAAMKAVNALLEPAGTLTLLVPAHPLLFSPFDRAIGHHRRYTKRDLRVKLEAAGFEIERLRESNPVGALGWFLNNVVLRRKDLHGIRLHDSLVPMLAAADRCLEFPVGLSLVAIARKV
jgi:SAM-dependent methyltransferase